MALQGLRFRFEMDVWFKENLTKIINATLLWSPCVDGPNRYEAGGAGFLVLDGFIEMGVIQDTQCSAKAHGVHGEEVYGKTITIKHLNGEPLWGNVYIRSDPYEVEKFDDLKTGW